jgi:hypothetical protein
MTRILQIMDDTEATQIARNAGYKNFAYGYLIANFYLGQRVAKNTENP